MTYMAIKKVKKNLAIPEFISEMIDDLAEELAWPFEHNNDYDICSVLAREVFGVY